MGKRGGTASLNDDRLRPAMSEKPSYEQLIEALRPFANAVFNDNGDVTYDHMMYSTDDLWRAYCLLRRAEKE